MTGGVTQQDGIEYGKYGTAELAQRPRTLRGNVQITSHEEVEFKKRVLNSNAWVLHNGTAYLTMPIPPMPELDETHGAALQARTLHAETRMQRAAQWLERDFNVSGVQGVISHEDGGTITLQLDAKQYEANIAPLAQQQRGALR